MYTLLRAVAIQNGANQRFASIDLTAINTTQLFPTYRLIYAVLNDGIDSDEYTLDLTQIMTPLMEFEGGTFVDYLASIDNQALPTVKGSPTLVRNNAIFSDLFEAGFWCDSIDYMVGAGVVLPQELKPHIVIKPDNVGDQSGYDYLTMRQKVLANINGFYHWTAADTNGLYVIDANKSRLKSGMNKVGLLSFATIGDLDLIQITPDMLSFEINSDDNTVDQVHIKFSSDVNNAKTPILILGGYMLMVDQSNLLMMDNNILTFKTYKYPLAERYFESNQYLDFSAFDVPHTTNDDAYAELAKLKSQEYLTGYFTMSQSFIVLIDAEVLVTEKSYVQTLPIPHSFMTWEDPKWPLVVCDGKHAVYWKKTEAGRSILRCVDTFKKNYMFRTSADADHPAVDDALFMGNAGRFSGGYFLKIIEEEVTINAT